MTAHEHAQELKPKFTWKERMRGAPYVLREMTEKRMRQLNPNLRRATALIGTLRMVKDIFGNVRVGPGIGSGFIVSAKDGWIMTNNHVIQDAMKDTIGVKFVNELQPRKATIVRADPLLDLAIIKVEGSVNASALRFGNSKGAISGQGVLAQGHPFGFFPWSLRNGIVSARRRQVVDGKTEEYIQHTAAINPGDSGGPLVDAYGEVIGVNRMIASKSGGNDGIGLAIPSEFAQEFFEETKKIERAKSATLH